MRCAMKYNRGFTLLELLVVMAISVILMGLVLMPVVQSFQITRRAQAMVDSQDAARMALLTISREMGQAMYVYDNASYSASIDTSNVPGNPTDPQTPIMLPVAQPDGTTQWFALPGGKIDFYLPKLYMHCNNPNHPSDAPRDFPREKVVAGRTELFAWPDCDACKAAGKVYDDVEARPKLPMEQDITIVRYFLGLRDNNISTANLGWVSPWGKNVVVGTENQVILYRVEFNPHDTSLFPASMPMDQRLADPFFFYRTGTAAGGGTYAKHWMDIARVVGIGKYEDLVTATTSAATGKIVSVEPTITFHTASVENDTFNPAYTSDKMNDYPTAPPTVFTASYGYWTPDSRVDVFRGNFTSNAATPQGIDFYTQMDGSDLVVMRYAPSESPTPSVEFNITNYLLDGYVKVNASGAPAREMAFTVDPDKGSINFAVQPPRQGLTRTGPVFSYDPAAINAKFKDDYATDSGGAIRKRLLPTFDSTNRDQYLANAHIVPGSERIIGPDMTFGMHFGKPVRYERVPLALGDPGANQYKIDYDTGWLFFSRDPSLDLPESDAEDNPGVVRVYYLICFNQKDDVVRGDYLTKSLINIHMGMRMFDPDSGKAHPMDLSDSVKVRNALR